MKQTLFAILFLVSFLSSCAGSATNNDKDVAQSLSRENQDKIILEYVDALNDFAQYTPIIGMDSESDWAAYECDSISKVIKNDCEGSFLKRMSGIYMMQAYCGYSMTYALSCWAIYGDEDNTAAMAFHSASVARDLYEEIEKEGFSDFDKIQKLAGYSFYYIQLYPHICNNLAKRNGDSPSFSENGFGLSLDAIAITDSLSKLNIPKEKVFRVASVLECVSFFQAFCPLVQGLAQSKEKYNAQHPMIIEFANFCDDNAEPIYLSFFKNPSKVMVIDGKEFEDFMMKALDYKTTMLKMLCENIKDMAKKQVS